MKMSSKGNDEQQPQAEAIQLEPVFERLAGVAPTILYVFDLQRMANVWANQSLFDYLGYRDSEVQQMGSEILPKLMHPDDMQRYGAHFERLIALKDGERAEFQYRMRHRNGQWVWLHSNETVHTRGADGAVTQIVGSAHDITELKNTTAELELVSSELRHRVANIFAVITAMTSITARVHPESTEVLSDLGDRIMALSYAHEATLNSEHRSSVDLAELVARVLRPFEGAAPIRTEIEDPLLLEDSQASPLGLICHELATNAVKYGGLRSGSGGLDIHLTREDDMIDMRWSEQLDPSNPPETSASSKPGFGSQLIDLSVQQLGGECERTFDADRVSIRIRFPSAT